MPCWFGAKAFASDLTIASPTSNDRRQCKVSFARTNHRPYPNTRCVRNF